MLVLAKHLVQPAIVSDTSSGARMVAEYLEETDRWEGKHPAIRAITGWSGITDRMPSNTYIT